MSRKLTLATSCAHHSASIRCWLRSTVGSYAGFHRRHCRSQLDAEAVSINPLLGIRGTIEIRQWQIDLQIDQYQYYGSKQGDETSGSWMIEVHVKRTRLELLYAVRRTTRKEGASLVDNVSWNPNILTWLSYRALAQG